MSYRSVLSVSNGGPWNPKLTLKINSLRIKHNAQTFASWMFSEYAFKIERKQGNETNIIKGGKWHPSCRCHDNSYAAGPVLIKTKIPRFYLKQGSFTPNNLMGRVKNHVYLVFHRKRLGSRVLPGQQLRCHSLPFVMHISSAKFKEHYSNISKDIVDWVLYCFSGTIYDLITFLICIIQT